MSMRKNITPRKPAGKTSPNRPGKAKMANYIIYAVLGIALAVYIIITAMPDGKSPPDIPSDISGSADDFSEHIGPASDDDRSSDISPPDTPSPGYDTSGSRVVLKAGENQSGSLIGACYVYVPAGFVAASSDASVTLTPENMDISVTGNRPLRISWGNVFDFDDLKSEWLIRDPKSGTYRIIAKYDYAAREDMQADVYIIEHKPLSTDNGDQAVYTIALDIVSGGLYPRASIPESDLRKFLSARYPDILELAKAIFRPVDPDAIISAGDIPGSGYTSADD